MENSFVSRLTRESGSRLPQSKSTADPPLQGCSWIEQTSPPGRNENPFASRLAKGERQQALTVTHNRSEFGSVS